MTTSAMLVGSYRAMPDQTLTFAGGAEEVTGNSTYGDSIYLYHSTAALSLITQVANAVANQESGGACVLLQNGKVKISATSTFTLTWTDTLARDLLGFATDGNLSGANSYTASQISPILWIPGTTESPYGAVLDRAGGNVHDAHTVTAPDGTQVTRQIGSALVHNRFEWRHIPKARYQTADELGGELSTFFDEVLVKRSKFMLHREITFDTSSSSDMTYDGAPLGPYEVRAPEMRKFDFKRASGSERIEKLYDFGMSVLVTPEYS